MRILAALAVIAISLLSVGCQQGGILLQSAQQGEWSNFKNTNHQVSNDAKAAPAEKPAAEK